MGRGAAPFYLLLLAVFFIAPTDLLEHVHGGHGHDSHRIYFVPKLKDAASVADLIFGRAHFT